MNPKEKVINRLTALIEQGGLVLGTRTPAGPGMIAPDSVDTATAIQWATSSQVALSQIFGSDSVYAINFPEVTKVQYYPTSVEGYSVLKAALSDIESGYLFEVRALIEANSFDSFLEQASYLLDAEYHAPAAVIIGAVLESTLRYLCDKHEIAYSEKETIDPLNAKLAKAEVYNKLTQKRIIALADLRNNAAHGKWDQFSKDDVIDMLKQVRSFSEEYIT